MTMTMMTTMMMMMMMIVDNRCSVCRGEPTSSSARCQCRTPTVNVGSSSSTRCANCGVRTVASSLCTRCSALPRCRRCKRHLPKRCFQQFDSLDDGGENDDDGDGDDERSRLCRACDRRRRKPTVRRSPDDIVTEIDMPIADSATYNSFDSFVATHQNQLRQHVEEHRQLHRYMLYCLTLNLPYSHISCTYLAISLPLSRSN